MLKESLLRPINDCDDISPSDENIDHRIAFLQKLDFVNVLFERTLTKRNLTRNWIPHMPIMFDIEIIKGKGHLFYKPLHMI